MPKSASSKRWLKEHFDDPYVQASKAQGYRSRAVFKLIELQQKYRFIKPGMTVVDLGAAPGGWSQIMTEWVGDNGQVIALDILPMDPIAGVEIITGDFTEQAIFDQLSEVTKNKSIQVVVSDMAPNISGIKVSDQAKSMYLNELALDFAKQVLTKNGIFLAKLFQGEGFDGYIQALRQEFAKVVLSKPAASRNRSREIYVLATL